ncbi:MAG: hypothetical protein Fues2KO_49400 [Fuerstiella sp.]
MRISHFDIRDSESSIEPTDYSGDTVAQSVAIEYESVERDDGQFALRPVNGDSCCRNCALLVPAYGLLPTVDRFIPAKIPAPDGSDV